MRAHTTWIRRQCWSLPLFLLFAAAGGLDAGRDSAGDASSLLKRADAAEGRVAYMGVKIVRTDAAREQEVRVWHAPPNKTRLEVLPPARIAGLITVEVGERRFHYHPWEQRWLSLPRPYKPPLEMLLRNYTVRQTGKATIAGRPTRIIQIRSRHPGNSQKNLWIDRSTGIVLKSELLDRNGNLVSWWQFREIEFPRTVSASLFATPPAMASGPDAPSVRTRSFQRVDKPDFTIAEPTYLPPGYAEVRRASYRHDGRDRVVIRYTDGLNVIVFLQQRAGGPRSERRDRPDRNDGQKSTGPRPDAVISGRRYRNAPEPGADGEATSHVNWKLGPLRLTLVGGVDRQQLDRMAASVTLPGDAASVARRAGER